MLKTPLLHPEILQALGRAGHGARVLVADGNYPVSTEAPPSAIRTFLNLRRGLVSVTDVLAVLVESVPVESALLMAAPDGVAVAVHGRICELLPAEAIVGRHPRHEFYAEARSPATTLVIATGEERRFANVLLTIGVVRGSLPDGVHPRARQRAGLR